MIGVIFFHKNIFGIYQEKWIKKSMESMIHQKKVDYKVVYYELNYEGSGLSLFKHFGFETNEKTDYVFINKEMKNHVEAMNFIISKAFDDGCKYVFNTNLDDYYRTDRLKQQTKLLDDGADIVSSDMCYIDENDKRFFEKYLNQFDTKEKIINAFNNGDNVIAHPCVGYSKKFWDNNKYLDEIPMEDFNLWKRTINEYNFKIHKDVLLFYRIHNSQITKSLR